MGLSSLRFKVLGRQVEDRMAAAERPRVADGRGDLSLGFEDGRDEWLSAGE